MARTTRQSFSACALALSLAGQDAEVREQAELEDVAVSELMRAALSDYLSRTRKQRTHLADDDEVPPEARNAIAESAHARKLARIRQRVPALPGMSISSSATLWQPPSGLPAPKQKGPYARREFLMSVDLDGNPVEPPANAVAWRVLVKHHRRPAERVPQVRSAVALSTCVLHHEFAYAVGYQSAAFYLQLDRRARPRLRFTEVYVPLGSAGNWDDD